MRQENIDKSNSPVSSLPQWAWSLLICPSCNGALSNEGDTLYCHQCHKTGNIDNGIVRFGIVDNDSSVAWYKAVDGTRFHERMHIPFTMSSLDTPVYWHYLENLKPSSVRKLIVDVGAGDGRNTEPWLVWGFERVIATDAVFSSLERFQSRLRREHPEWLERVLLIECDVRQLPIASAKADLVLAIEVLCYLNEDYELGLADCKRLLGQAGRILISERSWEGALLTRLLYGGLKEMLEICHTRNLLDGAEDNLVRSRTFVEEELVAVAEGAGLRVSERKGLSLLPLICGYLRQQGKFHSKDGQYLHALLDLLKNLGTVGKMRRTHVVVADNAQ